MQPNRHLAEPLHEVRPHPYGLPRHLHEAKALHHLLPQDPQLHLRKAASHAEVHPPAEGEVATRVLAVDQELVGAIDGGLVPVRRDVPHHNLVALLDGLACEPGVLGGGAAQLGLILGYQSIADLFIDRLNSKVNILTPCFMSNVSTSILHHTIHTCQITSYNIYFSWYKA